MVRWSELFNSDGHDGRHRVHDEMSALLPTSRREHYLPPPPIDPKDVTIVALRLKHQIEQVVPCELEEEHITKAHSHIITPAVLETAKQAGAPEHNACVVFCLLQVKKWFKKQATAELWDADLHNVRAVAAEIMAKRLIEAEEDTAYLFEEVLLKRYSTLIDGEPTTPANAVEKAVDLHAVTVIGSSGYQKCINYLWRGWIVQDDEDPSRFVTYENKTNTSYWAHLDPDRMRVPKYQNWVQIALSLIYLGLYTGAINTINPSGDLDVVEGLLYLFTLGFICDEVNKFWKVGRYYLSFWNMFNSTLYALLTVSFVLRMVALGHPVSDEKDTRRTTLNKMSYDFLAFTAPMFWMRLLLYLDTFRFFGAMLVVLKVMMRESLIFFALLLVVMVGFFQAFIGLDIADDQLANDTWFVIQAMLNAVMQSPEFEGFDNFSPPFGIILYYIFTFVVMVILLNILIALYNSAYEDITENAIDEYMALFSQKTMQFVRAPDENVFIAPFNLIEMVFLILPFEWWMDSARYDKLNDMVMAVIYSPLLLVTALLEQQEAWVVKENRRRGEDDEDTTMEWEQVLEGCDFEADGWDKKVKASRPNVEFDTAVLEVRELRKEVRELKDMMRNLIEGKSGAWGEDTLGDTLGASGLAKLDASKLGMQQGESSESGGRDE
ncbi:potassium ion channel Yvc1 [Pyrenophora tritici-repentis]|uniref:Potassium ion channel yvc1 protein n=1 Tax=Pyrenophora tritici-repentis TaxID=45151 RepID=A0A2W1EB60_9PLEO|nr:potassium ion channel yvc1 protein [Pyrenophora tritici-repentis]KAF7447505.1 potassium ion channel yvc1 protein [Pyrenophora tritici-repentis]KAG9382398.1 potassium ion channel yvc1 protein [Pyrenophora tritici-repentis]KAI0576513.1 potassium ion channel yvc1 protein [Pyrenophora tritici-repentis]KAI0580946.1 potassium ion channel yvc1 protein [Pyrenophora tritici-repentis]